MNITKAWAQTEASLAWGSKTSFCLAQPSSFWVLCELQLQGEQSTVEIRKTVVTRRKTMSAQ